ncbi:MAG: T9SS type A sorting domain-containing protein [Schleiferiaceae bacterium]|nr:T9SS type A sorting domain-containing protein [Schleiferiaceae bacterium]
MKHSITTLGGVVVAIAMAAAFHGTSNVDGAPAGHSGSPASNNQTCATSGCHTGPGASFQVVEITTNIPETGFNPNTNYTITVKGNGNSVPFSRIGFQASVEDAQGNHQGTINANPEIRVNGNGKFVTHRNSSVTPINGQRSFTFTWNSGAAEDSTTVFAAVNFANANGSPTGDVIKTGSLVLRKNLSFSTENLAATNFSVYPNPAKEHINVAFDNHAGGTYEIYMVDLTGRKVASFAHQNLPYGPVKFHFELPDLPVGLYNLIVSNGAFAKHQRVIIN